VGRSLAPAATQPDGADVLNFFVIHMVSCPIGYHRLITCATPHQR
jgi:hypothetical protein